MTGDLARLCLVLVLAQVACTGLIGGPGGAGDDGGPVHDGGAGDDGGSVRDGGAGDDGGSVRDGGAGDDGGSGRDGGAPVDAGSGDGGLTDGGANDFDAGSPSLAPHVFHHSTSLRPGGLVWLQGDRFGSTPRVWLQTPSGWLSLPVVSAVAGVQVVARLPEPLPQGAVVVRGDNGQASSEAVALNAPEPWHLDALSFVAGAHVRVFGRNLRVAGSTTQVRVGGQLAAVDLAHSDERTLEVIAPAGLPAGRTTLVVETGAGVATLARQPTVLAGAVSDAFVLGVGWSGGFGPLATRVTTVVLAANGTTDDGPAIQAALDAAGAAGGGVVQLPASTTIRLARTLTLPSKVVLRGAGPTKTVLRYEGQWAVYSERVEWAGLLGLGFSTTTASEGLVLKNSSHVFLRDVGVTTRNTFQSYFTGNSDLVVRGCSFSQQAGRNGQGPFTFATSSGLVFAENTVAFGTGAPDFYAVHDAVLERDTFTRDASNQTLVDQRDGVTHSLAIDFAHHLAIVDTSFGTSNGQVTTLARNDGETILTEGGGPTRTENVGTVSSAGPKTLTDGSNTFSADPLGFGSLPENAEVWVVAGTGTGQTRRITEVVGHTLTVDPPWTVVPDSTSRYATFVTGLEYARLARNRLVDNSRGIWLYQAAVREVEVEDNTLTRNGGIYLRAWQHVEPGVSKMFDPIYDVRIAGNVIVNEAQTNTSYLTALFVRHDSMDFGVAMLGLEISGNTVTCNTPPFTTTVSDQSSLREGYRVAVSFENVSAPSARLPWVLGPLLEGNHSSACPTPIFLGTGVGGAVIAGFSGTGNTSVWANEPAGGDSAGATGVVVVP